MATIEELHFIESEAVPKRNARFIPDGTSLIITYVCGCKLTHHLACSRLKDRRKTEPEESVENLNARGYAVELCPKHKFRFGLQQRVNKIIKQRHEYFRLQEYCLRLIRKVIVRNGCNSTDILKAMDLTPIVCAMPECDAVCNTLKGIIGYFYWLKEQERPFDHFVEDALHDLEECTINYHEKWYEPRTLQYVKFFKPE